MVGSLAGKKKDGKQPWVSACEQAFIVDMTSNAHGMISEVTKPREKNGYAQKQLRRREVSQDRFKQETLVIETLLTAQLPGEQRSNKFSREIARWKKEGTVDFQ